MPRTRRLSDAAHTRVRRTLLAWYDREKRQLPWRGTRDPYRIWVSEVMLQQTTVEAVRRRYEAFLERFPDLPSLARAREDSVLAAWSGLGYYARARNLRRAAREILRRHGGVFPRDPRVLRRLPGFGEYTAAAVASLAFGVRAAAADANITRVVSRLFAVRGLAGSPGHRREVLDHAGRLLPRGRPGAATAALMDLGQAICTARDPDCPRCPVACACAALRSGRPGAYPRKRERPRKARVALAVAFIEDGGRALLVRRRDGFLKGLWEFPCGPSDGESSAAARRGLSRTLSSLGLRRDRVPLGAVKHTVVHRRLEIEVFRGHIRDRGPTSREPNGRWFSARQLESAAIPTLARKIARCAGFLSG